MTRDASIAAIDVGTTKVCALLGELGSQGSLHLLGVGIGPARGLRKGVVVNIEEAVGSLSTAVERAERLAGRKITRAVVGLGGSHIASTNNRGLVGIGHADRAIRPEDVRRAIEAARMVTLPPTREILHALPRSFTVDGQEGVRNPVAMVGHRLDVEAHIVTGAATAVQNLLRCIARLDIAVQGLVLSGLAAAEAVLTEEEREMGVALADIGGGTTDVAIFLEGSVWHSAVLPLGGNNITRDIAVGLRAPFGAAEEMKLTYGCADSGSVGADETIEVATFSQGQRERVSRRQLCTIIEGRLQEIFGLIRVELRRAGSPGLLPAGLVLTGGSAELAGLAAWAREVLDMPVRLGTAAGLEGLADTVGGPAYAASVGLLHWAARDGAASITPAVSFAKSRPRRRANGSSGAAIAYTRLLGWLRAFLP